MKKSKKVVIVMPAYFAAKTLEKTYRDIPKRLRKRKNIILVDDASKDETLKVAKKLGIKTYRHKRNRGYGANQKTCYKYALKLRPDIVVMIHPDYQYDSSLAEDLIKPIIDGRYDIMLGNRIRGRREALAGGMPRYKYFGNRFLTIIENILLGRNLGEYHTGFRAYKREVLETLPFRKFSDDFVFDQEMLISAIYSGFRIGEIAVPVRYLEDSSSINFFRSSKYGFLTLLCLVKFLLDKWGLMKFKIFSHRRNYR